MSSGCTTEKANHEYELKFTAHAGLLLPVEIPGIVEVIGDPCAHLCLGLLAVHLGTTSWYFLKFFCSSSILLRSESRSSMD